MFCCVVKKIFDGINVGRKMELVYSSSMNGLFLWWNGRLIVFLIWIEYLFECVVNCVIYKWFFFDFGGLSEVYIWNGVIFCCGLLICC